MSSKYTSYSNLLIIIFIITIILYVNYDIQILYKYESFIDKQNNPTDLLTIRKNMIKSFLEEFKMLKIPINIDDNGVECNNWNNYKGNNPNILKVNNNHCQLIGNDSQCLNNNDDLITCNKMYNEDIKNMSKVDIDNIVDQYYTKLGVEFINTNKEIDDKYDIVNDLIERIINKKNLLQQQQYFVKLNQEYLGNNRDRTDELNNKYVVLNNNKNIRFNKTEDINLDLNTYDNMNSTLTYVIYILFVILILFMATYFLMQKIKM